MAEATELMLGFYGDDFTGATDAMESLARAGLRTVLFVNPPTAEQLKRYPNLRAVGVAGLTRSLPTEQMEAELVPALRALGALGPPIVHYKICSTFDSSPAIGSVGRAIEVGMSVFGGSFVPVLGGAPALGRYCVFGNLFARSGVESAPYRLDRHPSMSCHPITPMDEADLRIHLSRQTAKRIALLDLLHLAESPQAAEAHLEQMLAERAEIVLIDLLYENQLAAAGRLLDACTKRHKPLYVVGPSGVEAALTAWWRLSGLIRSAMPFAYPGPAWPMVVVSGSCSPVTARQIGWALAHDFVAVPINVEALAETGAEALEAEVAGEAIGLLSEGRGVILHTGLLGQDFSDIPAAPPKAQGDEATAIRSRSGKIVGQAMGRVLRTVLQAGKVKRVVVAGGDTAGYVARQVGIESLEMIAELTPGAPLCRVHAPASPADGLEITFKGGQIGKANFLGLAAAGREEALRG